jgi:hypothetical protein
MIQCDPGYNIVLNELVDEMTVKVKTCLINITFSIWQDSWPSNGELICFQTQSFHQFDICIDLMIVIACNSTIFVIQDIPWL